MSGWVLYNSSNKPIKWKRQITLISSLVSILLKYKLIWIKTEAMKRKSYRGKPKSGIWFDKNKSTKKEPAKIQALASLSPKANNSEKKKLILWK